MPLPDVCAPIYSRFADDPDFGELIEYFIGEMPQRMESLRTAAERRDFETLRELAHQLKGAAGGYGFDIISERAAVLEQATREVVGDSLQPALEELLDVCNRARADRPA
ncbi:MAG: Hpt domain-containing protein [Planctomycetota bacterium]|nr:MAG: Hpt domain-containing protein [Planctomycetota bacterium]